MQQKATPGHCYIKYTKSVNCPQSYPLTLITEGLTGMCRPLATYYLYMFLFYAGVFIALYKPLGSIKCIFRKVVNNIREGDRIYDTTVCCRERNIHLAFSALTSRLISLLVTSEMSFSLHYLCFRTINYHNHQKLISPIQCGFSWSFLMTYCKTKLKRNEDEACLCFRKF
jgi:hypothetical protein